MKHPLETARLRVRQFQGLDLDRLYSLDSDAEVMKYIADGKTLSLTQVRESLIRNIKRYAEWKVYGVWALELKETGDFIGWVCLKPLPNTKDIEVGYRLLKKHWGQGYATEAARKMLEYGFETLGLKQIVAITNLQNQASKHVLEKAGLIYKKDIEYKSSPESLPQQVCLFTAQVA